MRIFLPNFQLSFTMKVEWLFFGPLEMKLMTKYKSKSCNTNRICKHWLSFFFQQKKLLRFKIDYIICFWRLGACSLHFHSLPCIAKFKSNCRNGYSLIFKQKNQVFESWKMIISCLRIYEYQSHPQLWLQYWKIQQTM